MKIITTFAALSQVPSATVNSMQTRAAGLTRATQNQDIPAAGGAGQREGADGVIWQKATALPAAQLILLDDTIDWRDRLVRVQAVDFTAAASRIGGVTGYFDWSLFNTSFGFGYTGTGAYSNVAVSTLVSNGNPPLAASGAGGSSYRVTLASLGAVHLYTDPSGANMGKLFLYNDSGVDIFPLLWIEGSSDLGVF